MMLIDLSFPWSLLNFNFLQKAFSSPQSQMFSFIFFRHIWKIKWIQLPLVLLPTQRPRRPRNVISGFCFNNSTSAYNLPFANRQSTGRFRGTSLSGPPFGGAHTCLLESTQGCRPPLWGALDQPPCCLHEDGPNDLARGPGPVGW